MHVQDAVRYSAARAACRQIVLYFPQCKHLIARIQGLPSSSSSSPLQAPPLHPLLLMQALRWSYFPVLNSRASVGFARALERASAAAAAAAFEGDASSHVAGGMRTLLMLLVLMAAIVVLIFMMVVMLASDSADHDALSRSFFVASRSRLVSAAFSGERPAHPPCACRLCSSARDTARKGRTAAVALDQGMQSRSLQLPHPSTCGENVRGFCFVFRIIQQVMCAAGVGRRAIHCVQVLGRSVQQEDRVAEYGGVGARAK